MNTQPISPKDQLQVNKVQSITFQLGKLNTTQKLTFQGFNPEQTFATFERTSPLFTEFFKYSKGGVLISKESREVKTIAIPVKNIKVVQ